ncbi:MAG: hypothetical protein F6K11_00705 [Leptolyngbya sp. SIO3F4]|nr:hypothetical protein [Leptolyngbya sp. SIO3F4]
MATQAGIGVLIGLGIGSGVTAFIMQRIIRRQDNALQQSLNRLNRLQEDHAQDLNSALAKMETDYEQQLATKIERYQDTHEEQLSELEAEYEARIAALIGVDIQVSNEEPETPTSAIENIPIKATPLPQPSTSIAFTTIPDPWSETVNQPVAPKVATVQTSEVAPEPETAPATPPPTATTTTISSTPSRINSPLAVELTETANELGKAAAMNRKNALRAVPQLGKLTKNNNADIRLAAVSALQESGSIKAIPFLRQALRDTDSRVVATASAALSRFKGAKKPTSKVKATKKKRRR